MKLSAILMIMFSCLACQRTASDLKNNNCEKLELYPTQIPVDFKFSLEIEGPLSYTYHSSKSDFILLINPFSKPKEVYHTDVILAENEKILIWKKLSEIDILKYPQEYKPKSNFELTPQKSYKLSLEFNGISKHINWAKNAEISECLDALRLRNVINSIDSLITRQIDYNRFPEIKYEWL